MPNFTSLSLTYNACMCSAKHSLVLGVIAFIAYGCGDACDSWYYPTTLIEIDDSTSRDRNSTWLVRVINTETGEQIEKSFRGPQSTGYFDPLGDGTYTVSTSRGSSVCNNINLVVRQGDCRRSRYIPDYIRIEFDGICRVTEGSYSSL
jgi:hypothetical protein